MLGRAIAAGALGAAGLSMLTSDIGKTRLAKILRPQKEGRETSTGRDGPCRPPFATPRARRALTEG